MGAAADPRDVDFSARKRASLVYGNAKRYLMLALIGLFAREERVTLSVAHPGISFTNITAHYPKLLFALIKHPMKWIFMKPRVACLSVIKGIFSPCRGYEWIGPGILDVWGKPKKKPQDWLQSQKPNDLQKSKKDFAWRRKPKKGAASRDSPGGGANGLRSPGARMGEPGGSNVPSLLTEYIGQAEGTRGTETSKYP